MAEGEAAVAGGDVGAEGDAGAVDTGGAEGGVETEGVDGGGEQAAPKEPTYKVRRFGKEAEYTVAQMREMLDDDFEHSFHGVGGKPLLQDGKPLTRKMRDIVRDVQMSKGAADSARRHNEAAKRFQQQIDWAKDPGTDQSYPNLMPFLRDVIGIEDPRALTLRHAALAFHRRGELAELAQKDPIAHQRELEKDFREEQLAMQRALQSREQTQRQEAERQQREQQFYGTVTDHLGKVGVPYNARTRELVDQTCREWSEAGAELSFEQLAEIVRDAWHEEIFGYIDPKSDDDLLKLLGDKRRERLRKAEITAMKGAKKAAEPAKPKPTTQNGNGAQPAKGMTAEEFMRKSRNSGRV